MFCSSQEVAAAPMQPANCVPLRIGEPALTKALYGYVVGASKVILTVSSSTASTEAMPVKALCAVQPVASSTQ